MNNLTMEFQDPKGRSTTRRFSKDAEVKFTDGKGFFRNPSVFDLCPPMYVHSTFTDDIIQSFDVVELGLRQVAVDHGGTRETFQLTSQSDVRVSQRDKVQLRTEWSGQRELVVEMKVLTRAQDSNDDSGDRRLRGRRRGY